MGKGAIANLLFEKWTFYLYFFSLTKHRPYLSLFVTLVRRVCQTLRRGVSGGGGGRWGGAVMVLLSKHETLAQSWFTVGPHLNMAIFLAD